jgi:hypothetical protein
MTAMRLEAVGCDRSDARPVRPNFGRSMNQIELPLLAAFDLFTINHALEALPGSTG